MANIESRRKIRIVIPIIISAAALLIIGTVITLIIVFSKSRPNDEPEPTFSAESFDPTDKPAASVSVSSAPSADATQAPVDTPAPVETSAPAPIRVSEENSLLIVEMHAVNGSAQDGGLVEIVTGSCAAEFVNNTNQPLYSADFYSLGLNVISASVNGVPARFSISDDGVLTIPFLEELPVNASCSVYFEFEACILPDGEFAIPCFGNDMACSMYASITSDTPVIFTGISPSSSEEDGEYLYSIDNEVVYLITARFHF